MRPSLWQRGETSDKKCRWRWSTPFYVLINPRMVTFSKSWLVYLRGPQSISRTLNTRKRGWWSNSGRSCSKDANFLVSKRLLCKSNVRNSKQRILDAYHIRRPRLGKRFQAPRGHRFLHSLESSLFLRHSNTGTISVSIVTLCLCGLIGRHTPGAVVIIR